MKKIINVIILAVLIIFIFSIKNVHAFTLNLGIKADKEKVKLGDNVTVTIDWKNEM